MTRILVARGTATALALLMLFVLNASHAVAQAPAAPAAPAVQGTWKSGDTTLRITVNKTEARGAFVELGAPARTLGFKPGETSFVATASGTFLYGEQTIRYGGNCYANGRKVAMMARMTADGRVLAIHNYVPAIDPACRDTGEYAVDQTLWQRQAGR